MSAYPCYSLTTPKRNNRNPRFPYAFILLCLIFTLGSRGKAEAALAAPTNLTAYSASTTQINLIWLDNSTNETAFIIERDLRNDGVFYPIATVGANVRNYYNTGLADGFVYTYRVRAFNGREYSAYSNTATAATRTAYPINAPTNLTASALSPTQVALSWIDNSNNEALFDIESGTGRAGPFTYVGSAGPNSTAFTHSGLTSGTWYYYQVRAVNVTKYSGYTSVKPVQLLTITASAGAGGTFLLPARSLLTTETVRHSR